MVSSINENNPIAGSPTTQSVRDNFGAAKSEINKMLRMGEDAVTTTTTGVNTFVADFSNNVTLVEGLRICVKANTTNTTGTTTLNVDGTGAVPVVNTDGSNLAGGQISGSNHYLDLMYNATNSRWVLLNPKTISADRLTTSRDITLTGAVTGTVSFSGSSDVSMTTTASSAAGLAAYPVGAIYISVDNANPSTIFAGTWSPFGAGRVLVGVDPNDTDFDTAEEEDGHKTHTLLESEMPAHTHVHTVQTGRSFSSSTGSAPIVQGSSQEQLDSADVTTSSTGGGQAHNNLQPYITVYMWKRTL